MFKFSAGAEVKYEAACTERSVLQRLAKKRQAGINGRGTASGRMLQENATKTFSSKFTPKVYQVKVSMRTQKVYSVKSQCSVNKLSPQCLHHQFSLLTNQESSLLGRFANPPILSSPSFHKPSCGDCEQAA